MITDPFSVGVPVFMANCFTGLALMQFPNFACLYIHHPQPMVNFAPASLVAESDVIRIGRGGVYMCIEIVIFKQNFTIASSRWNTDNPTQRFGVGNSLQGFALVMRRCGRTRLSLIYRSICILSVTGYADNM